MLDNPYLDTIISVVLIYALLSVIVSLLLEMWNSLRKQRGEFLWTVIERMLKDRLGRTSLGTALYDDPVIAALFTASGRKPAYISAQDFTHALISTVVRMHPPPGIPAVLGIAQVPLTAAPLPLGRAFEASVATMPDSDLRTLFKGFIQRSTAAGEVDPDRLRKDICRWFDDRMDRASGEYKLGQRWKLFIFGMVTAVGLNVDSLHLVRVILMDQPLREVLVAQAGVAADAFAANRGSGQAAAELAVLDAMGLDTLPKLGRIDSLRVRFGMDTLLRAQAQRIDAVLAVLDQWRLPLGWSSSSVPSAWFSKPSMPSDGLVVADRVLLDYVAKRNEVDPINVFLYLLGILSTGFALSFGAPFWFEALVKLVNIRRAGTKPARADAPATEHR